MDLGESKVARTAYDLVHVNRIRVPGFGVTELRLKTQDGSKTSDSCTALKTEKGTEKAFCFAPGRKLDGAVVDPVKISYVIYDPGRLIKRAKLELFRRFKADPVWTQDLAEEQYKDGEHAIAWNGILAAAIARAETDAEKIQKEDNAGTYTHQFTGDPKKEEKEFPDGFVNVDRSPYRLKLTVGGDMLGDPATAWTDFHILAHSIELEMGPVESLPRQTDLEKGDHRQVWTSLVGANVDVTSLKKAVPADGETKKVYLTSNLYKMTGGEMDDNSAYSIYEAVWGDGPMIPLFARIFLLNSQAKKEESFESAVGLGNVRCLWDYEDVAEDTSGQATVRAKTFIDRALAYYKDTSLPKGDNCHKDRGGKRVVPPAPDARSAADLRPVFLERAGEDATDTPADETFPFKVVACDVKKRSWSALSLPWRTGKHAGKTGVIFQPSRIAGDTYKVRCCLAFDRDKDDKALLDTAENIDAEIKAATGAFQIWRKIHISKLTRKTDAVTDILTGAPWAAIQRRYHEAFIEVELRDTLIKNLLAADDYKTAADNALKAGLGNRKYQILVKKNQNQYIGTGTPGVPSRNALTFNTWNEVRAAAYNYFMAEWQANNRTFLPGALHPHVLVDRDNWLNTNYPSGEEDYASWLDDRDGIIQAALEAMNLLDGVADGVTIFAFDKPVNITHPNAGSTLGIAIDMTGRTRHRCAYLGYSDADDTASHEIGHHLMCPHAPTAGGYVAASHDKDDTKCLMSYSRPRISFCGLCQLRLRGWSRDVLDKDGTKNTKP